jgi:hypothetical protein
MGGGKDVLFGGRTSTVVSARGLSALRSWLDEAPEERRP